MDEQRDRQLLHDEFDQIPVPEALVHDALAQGVKKAPRQHRVRNGLLAAAAALALTTAGLAAFVPQVGQAFDNVGWLAAFYLRNGNDVNATAFHVNGVAKSLNQTATSHGITVHLVEAYYAGKIISVTGEITGMTERQINMNGEHELSYYAASTAKQHFFNDTYDFQETKSGYRFRLLYHATANTAPTSVTLPIRIQELGGVFGRWNFDLKMSQPAPVVTKLAGATYDFGVPGLTVAPVALIKYAHGAELQYRATGDSRYEHGETGEIGIMSIQDAQGHSLIDMSDGMTLGGPDGSLTDLALTKLPVRGQAYRVQVDYFVKGEKSAREVTKSIVLWP
ncbi:DUF4179 domain-containing protein [Lacticaseibacillus parakribbianus]|uniref:DUF4179 domain-containing protein n=1 Tax=Lacticaseibacillus parakribbianus TaxID=2970927 RepID=UPI0021CAEDAE|nr:DUF4179 domain-containing protein [Lacticaseibacillus parakribbianus]